MVKGDSKISVTGNMRSSEDHQNSYYSLRKGTDL